MGGSHCLTTIVKTPEIINLRVTFRKTPIHILEKFTFKDTDFAYQTFQQEGNIDECMLLQTCNRIEVFAVGDNIDPQTIINGWSSILKVSDKELIDIVEVERGDQVIRHILRLVSGLDSLVVGEDQILGQVKRAFEFSKKGLYIGSNLSFIFDKAIKVGSKVRTITGINKGSISVGSVAVNLAEEYSTTLDNQNILLIGSGEGAGLVAKTLKKRNIPFMVTSRTFERAKSFSETMAGTPILFDKALENLSNFDIIFVSSIAPYYLLTSERIQNIMIKRHKPLIIFDLSNPRTVEESIGSIADVLLINIDKLATIVDKNLKFRIKEINSAEKIIEDELINMDIMIKRKRAEPFVVSVFRNVDKIRDRELKKALSILGADLGVREIKILEQFSHALLEGIMSTPMNNLRKEVQDGNLLGKEQEIMKIMEKIFNYENDRHDF